MEFTKICLCHLLRLVNRHIYRRYGIQHECKQYSTVKVQHRHPRLVFWTWIIGHVTFFNTFFLLHLGIHFSKFFSVQVHVTSKYVGTLKFVITVPKLIAICVHQENSKDMKFFTFVLENMPIAKKVQVLQNVAYQHHDGRLED